MRSLSDKVAIITGASSGIGQAIALRLAKNGVKVTLVARNKNKLEAIANSLNKLGLCALAIPIDITNENHLIDLFKTSNEYWGHTDILINNAGVIKTSNFHSGNPQDWKQMWEINVFAACLAIQEVLKYFDDNIGGQIINISSLSAYRVVKGGSFYSATKFALRAITEALRKELVENNSKTRVSCISPGLVATSFGKLKNLNDKVIDNKNKNALDVDDIVDAVIYILKTPSHVAVCDILLRSYNQLD